MGESVGVITSGNITDDKFLDDETVISTILKTLPNQKSQHVY